MIVALIPARYESTRLPGKPLLKFGNKTMIQMVYQRTCQSNYIDKTNIQVMLICFSLITYLSLYFLLFKYRYKKIN